MKVKFNAKVTLSTLAFVFTTFATPALASGYYTYDYTTPSDAAAATGILGASAIWICCACVLPLVIDAVLAYVVYKDAKKNNVDNPALWAALTFFFSLLALLIYYLAIKPEAVKKNSGVSGVVNDVKEKVEEKIDETKQS